jgi:uncharacterized membrane protein
MEEAKMVLYAVVITIVVGAAIFTGIDVFLALKAARRRKPEYFNSGYKPEHGTEFCRAHLVGRVYRLDNKMLCLVEIHPEDATRVYAWTVPETELRGVYLLEKGKFYKLAFEEELYD